MRPIPSAALGAGQNSQNGCEAIAAPPPGRSPAPSGDRVPATTRNPTWPPIVADHQQPRQMPLTPCTRRTDAPAAPTRTAAPTHRPTPHAPHPRAPPRRPTRNPPPPTRYRRSHSASPPPPLILPADRHPPQPDSATTSELRHPRRPVAPPTQRVAPSSDSGPGVPVNSLPSWKAGDPHAHLASYPWTSPLTRQLHLDIATYPWTGHSASPSVPVEGCERLPGLPGVRKVGPDSLTRRCSDQGCNFGTRAGLNSAAIPALRALDTADTGSPSQRSPEFATSVARYVQTSQPSPGHDSPTWIVR